MTPPRDQATLESLAADPAEPVDIGDERPVREVEIAIVGAGFAGIAAAVRLRQLGIVDFIILERGDEVGGTWRDNTYPGAACDVPSHLYSLSFAPNPNWSRTFSKGPEIQRYLVGVADRFGLREHLELNTTVGENRWDQAARRWVLETDRGDVRAKFLVGAIGGLSEPKLPDVEGIEDFEGEVFHSARWNHDLDLTGRRVAVIGTGASAIQFVPAIQPIVENVTVFQRTPAWVLPRLDRPVTPLERLAFRMLPLTQKLNRGGIYFSRELVAFGMTRQPRLLDILGLIAKAHMRRAIADPQLRRELTPDYTLGCKRMLLSNDWYPTMTRENVDLVTSGVVKVEGNAVIAADGTRVEVDTIICGTGFHVTDTPAVEHIHGRHESLAEAWSDGMSAYLGTSVHGFPNLFMMAGPNSGTGHMSQVFMLESMVEHMTSAIQHAQRRGIEVIEVRSDVEERYSIGLQSRMGETVWTTGGCASWYLDENGNNTTMWPGFTMEWWLRNRRFEPKRFQLTLEDLHVGPVEPEVEFAVRS